MKSIQAADFNKFIHSVRNPLNSISLNAELGKMLIDEQAGPEQLKKAFNEILQQCKNCEQVLTQMRKKHTEDAEL